MVDYLGIAISYLIAVINKEEPMRAISKILGSIREDGI